MIKLAEHHTVADWDFQADITKILDTTYKVSLPSSLRITTALGAYSPRSILCRIALTQCIAQGELRTWFMTWMRTNSAFLNFRNQAALGSANYINTYDWEITGTWAYLYRRIAGVPTEIGHFGSGNWANGAWVHYRTIYWNGKTPAGIDALAVELYWEVAGVWTKLGDTLYDTTNQWKDSVVNRSGVGAVLLSGQYHYFDDTEIWGAV